MTWSLAGVPSAALYNPSASITAAAYTNAVGPPQAEYAYSNDITTKRRGAYVSVNLTPMDSSQWCDNSRDLTTHETPTFTNWEPATTALQEENLTSDVHAY
ncbi:hypothetical protein QAD02_002274 [Eretmocerus hayati]|uniref:Uncharacterized protein n=1 Tax=Eretmocerus hayati TaxID=131215 RepID=A0ACC2NIN0_9HYME|nr:hypothetical protein QAD02_002274 [Eretmocerus hayati]